MRQIPFCIVDAFTETPFQGNPAGVFFDDHAVLSDEDCLKLCAEVSLESAFVLPADNPDAHFRLRYFTGATEVPLCGHATVAAAVSLVDSARLTPPCSVRVQTNVGILPLTLVVGDDGRTLVTLHQKPPVFGEPLSQEWRENIAGALGIEMESITQSGLPMQIVSTGTPWLLVPVASRDAVDQNDALANAVVIRNLSRQLGTFGIYLFTIEGKKDDRAVWSRCFAPVADLPEDPVTGSATGCLGGYLAENNVLDVSENGSAQFISRQGFAGRRGGVAQVRVTKENGEWRPSVTGSAIITAAGMFSL